MASPPNSLLAYYEEVERDNLTQITYLQRDLSLMAQIREDFGADWEVEELTRAIMHDETQIIQSLAEEVEFARAEKKKLV